MQHRPVRHGQRQILRPAAAGVLRKIDRQDPARRVMAHGIVDAEIMPLAGDDHVVITVIAHLGRPPGQSGGNGTGAGQRVALAFLAAETAAHAPRLDADGMHRQAQRVGHLVLDLGRVLGRAMHQHVAAFLRQDQRGLAFQVEMFLPADLDPARQAVRCGGQRRVDIALGIDARAILEAGLRGQGLVDGQHGRFTRIVDLPQPRRRPRGVMAGGDDQEERLAQVMDRPIAKQRLVMGTGRDIIGAGQIGSRDHRHDAGGRADGAEIHRGDLPARDIRQAEGQMQRARRCRDIIDIARRAGHMQGRGIMGKRAGNAHGRTSSTWMAAAAPESSAW